MRDDDLKTDLGEREQRCPAHGAFQAKGTRYHLPGRDAIERWTSCPACFASIVPAEQPLKPIAASLPTGPLSVDLGESPRNCETHGFYAARGTEYRLGKTPHTVWTRCPGCAQAEVDEVQAAEHSRAADARMTQLTDLLGQTAIPKRFIGRTIESFIATTPEQRRAQAIARAYAGRFDELLDKGKGLIFGGGPGTGKSHLAGGILQAIFPKHVGVYTTLMGMLFAIRDTYGKKGGRTEGEVIEELSSVPLLVLDEVGAQRGTNEELLMLFEVMDRRYRRMLPVILITNQDIEGLKTFVGERVQDRLLETSPWVSFTWDSYRKEAGARA
jgi:DNA replication protein DnaC